MVVELVAVGACWTQINEIWGKTIEIQAEPEMWDTPSWDLGPRWGLGATSHRLGPERVRFGAGMDGAGWGRVRRGARGHIFAENC